MRLLIEKIEGPWATIEWGKANFQIPKLLLPSNAKVGDSISIEIILHQGDERLRFDKSHLIIDDYNDLD